MVRNSHFNSFHNKKGFTGYRIRPTYLERLNNYLQGVESNHPSSELEEQHTNYEEEYVEEQEQKYQPHHHHQQQQAQSRQTTNYNQRTSRNQPGVQSVAQPHQPQPQYPQENNTRRPVSSSDLRNKRNQVVNGSYQYNGGHSRPGRRGVTYGIKPSYSSGAFQTDGL